MASADAQCCVMAIVVFHSIRPKKKITLIKFDTNKTALQLQKHYVGQNCAKPHRKLVALDTIFCTVCYGFLVDIIHVTSRLKSVSSRRHLGVLFWPVPSAVSDSATCLSLPRVSTYVMTTNSSSVSAIQTVGMDCTIWTEWYITKVELCGADSFPHDVCTASADLWPRINMCDIHNFLVLLTCFGTRTESL